MSGEVVTIEAIAGGGDGVGHLADGRVVFVPRSAPGDRVRLAALPETGRWVRAESEELVSPGPHRVEPRCVLYDRCGGCQLQHLDYDAQLHWKSRAIADALTRIGGVPVDPPEIAPSPEPWRYRTRMTFTLRRLPGGRVVAGLHERLDPRRVLDIGDECLLPIPSLMEVWIALRAGWGEGARHLPGGARLRLTLGEAEDGVHLVVAGAEGTGNAAALLEAVPGLDSVWVADEGARARLLGARRGGGRSVLAFTQANRGAEEALRTIQLERIEAGPGVRVVDAYAGDGALGALLAGAGAEVVSIERDPEAVRLARARGGAGQRVVRGDVEEVLPAHLPADVVLLNPPRTGLADAVPEMLLATPPRSIVYTSCDPATLARDLRRLSPRFEVREIRACDLFPQTAHVETVVRLDARSTETASAGKDG